MPWYGTLFVLGGTLLLLCCGSLLLIRTLLIVIIVQGSSMAPTLEGGEHVLALRPLRRSWIRKGQIILFKQGDSDGVPDPLSLHLKRVVAQAGEQYRSSTPPLGYNEHVAQEGQEYIWQIPQEHIFVCGDNREQSVDSRSWGSLPLRNVRGIVVKKLAPSPASLSAHVAIAQRSTSNETPDRFHVERH